jgi:GNAT superfamily N-acetyltransferase
MPPRRLLTASHMTARIRPMAESDADAIAELTTLLGYPVDAATTRTRLAEVAARPHDAVLVAVDDADRPIGWIHVGRLAILEASDLASINGLVVTEDRQSSGIGSALVSAAEDWARSAGATAITVRSRSTRERAHRFYERIGYVEIKRSRVFEKPLR